MTSDAEIAWAAGLFEGEGSITIFHPRGKPCVRLGLSLVSTDRDVLDRFCSIVQCSHVTELKRATKKNKRVYRWQTQALPDVRKVLHLMLPHLGERRTAKAHEALEMRKKYENDRN